MRDPTSLHGCSQSLLLAAGHCLALNRRACRLTIRNCRQTRPRSSARRPTSRRLTHAGPKPAHERTAEEEAGAINWESIAASERFQELLRAKRRFIIPAMIFFIVYYFALPVLVGYARPFMEKRVLGRGEPGLSLRALAVLHGLDHRRALRPRRESLRPDGATRSSEDETTRCMTRTRARAHARDQIGASLRITSTSMSTSGGNDMTPALGMFLLFVLITLGITWWAARRSQSAAAFFTASRRITGWQNGVAVAGDYMSAASFLGIAGSDRVLWLRRLHVFGRLAGRVSHRVARRGGTVAQCRQIHHGGRARLSAESATGARDGGAEHDHGQHVLHDRADGRRGSARHTSCSAARMSVIKLAVIGGRRAHDHLRRLRRHARHDLGADHQGDPAHGRNHSAESARARAFRLEPWRIFSMPRPA